MVGHCYPTSLDIQDDRTLAARGAFPRKMGREAKQGEIGLVVGDEVFLSDVPPLLALGVVFDGSAALERVREAFISRLPQGASGRKRKERRRR